MHHQYEVPTRKLKLMNLWNGCQFCNKWGYDIHPRINELAEEVQMSISLAERYSLNEFLKIAETILQNSSNENSLLLRIFIV